MRWLVFIASILLALSPAAAQTFPALTGRVVDAASVIPDDQEAALAAKLEGVETQSGRQLVVATIPSLEGYPIEDYGYRLGRNWKIGEKGKNNGLILLVAPNDRKVRIEVGYGLEPIMTDALSSVIIGTQIVPAFKAGDIPGGIVKGVDAIIPQLTLPPEEAAQRAKSTARAQPEEGVDISAVIFWLFIFFFFILPTLRAIFGRGRRGRRYGSGRVIIWGGGSDWGSGGGGSSWSSGDSGFSGGGGDFGGGGASGDW